MQNPNLDATGDFLSKTEKELEKVLRPQAFEQFSGQPQIIENLNIFIQAAKQRDEAFAIALPYLEKAYAIDPKNVDYKSNLKKVYASMNMVEKAKALGD